MASNTTEEKGEGINRWKTATIEFCSETTAHGFCNLNRFGRSKVGTEIGSITVNICVLLWGRGCYCERTYLIVVMRSTYVIVVYGIWR